MSPQSGASTAVATGTSVATAGTRAGREATSAARDRLDAERVDFCQVFASSGFDPEAVLAGVNALVDDETAVVGCTAGGTFTEERTMDAGVAVTLVTSDSFRFDTALPPVSARTPVGLSEMLSERFPKISRNPTSQRSSSTTGCRASVNSCRCQSSDGLALCRIRRWGSV